MSISPVQRPSETKPEAKDRDQFHPLDSTESIAHWVGAKRPNGRGKVIKPRFPNFILSRTTSVRGGRSLSPRADSQIWLSRRSRLHVVTRRRNWELGCHTTDLGCLITAGLCIGKGVINEQRTNRA